MFSPHRRQKSPEELAHEHQKRLRAGFGLGAMALGGVAGAASGIVRASPASARGVGAAITAGSGNVETAPAENPAGPIITPIGIGGTVTVTDNTTFTAPPPTALNLDTAGIAEAGNGIIANAEANKLYSAISNWQRDAQSDLDIWKYREFVAHPASEDAINAEYDRARGLITSTADNARSQVQAAVTDWEQAHAGKTPISISIDGITTTGINIDKGDRTFYIPMATVTYSDQSTIKVPGTGDVNRDRVGDYYIHYQDPTGTVTADLTVHVVEVDDDPSGDVADDIGIYGYENGASIDLAQGMSFTAPAGWVHYPNGETKPAQVTDNVNPNGAVGSRYQVGYSGGGKSTYLNIVIVGIGVDDSGRTADSIWINGYESGSTIQVGRYSSFTAPLATVHYSNGTTETVSATGDLDTSVVGDHYLNYSRDGKSATLHVVVVEEGEDDSDRTADSIWVNDYGNGAVIQTAKGMPFTAPLATVHYSNGTTETVPASSGYVDTNRIGRYTLSYNHDGMATSLTVDVIEYVDHGKDDGIAPPGGGGVGGGSGPVTYVGQFGRHSDGDHWTDENGYYYEVINGRVTVWDMWDEFVEEFED